MSELTIWLLIIAGVIAMGVLITVAENIGYAIVKRVRKDMITYYMHYYDKEMEYLLNNTEIIITRVARNSDIIEELLLQFNKNSEVDQND